MATSKLSIPTIHIGEEIKKRFNISGLTQREFGARIGMSQQNVHRVFENESLDTKRLAAVSLALNFNFFELFSNPSVSSVHTEGDHSPAAHSGNISMVYGDAILVEKVKSLEAQIKDKEKIIKLLEERK